MWARARLRTLARRPQRLALAGNLFLCHIPDHAYPLTRRPSCLSIDRIKLLAESHLMFNRAAVLTGHFQGLALRGDTLGQLLVHLGAQALFGVLICGNPCHPLDRVTAQRI
jgi:hypothetical protein